MDQIEDPHELEREIERASRLASGITDQTTYQWLKQFVEELRQRLRHLLAGRRAQEAVRARARELWEINGRPGGRDLEFWLQAERERCCPRHQPGAEEGIWPPSHGCRPSPACEAGRFVTGLYDITREIRRPTRSAGRVRIGGDPIVVERAIREALYRAGWPRSNRTLH